MPSFRIKFILFNLLTLFIICACGLVYFYFGLISPNSGSAEKIDFEIKSGQGINKISDNLSNVGLIKSKLIFETYIWLRNWSGKIKAGKYRLTKNLNVKDLVGILKTGRIKKEVRIKIIEGWTIDEIGSYLERNGIVSGDEFVELANNPGEIFNFQSIQRVGDEIPIFKKFLIDQYSNIQNSKFNSQNSLEGYLFPDTYNIYSDSTVEDIIKKMLDNFNKKLDVKMRAEIKRQGKTINEVIILASIVEREVAAYDDRQMVADIFFKRLKANMPLQSDATINYITKKKTVRPSYEDLQIESAYNTYKNKGLPPGPIGNPGLAAIQSVIYPIANNYYYFLTDKDGVVHYGRNLEEHMVNRRMYLD